MVQAHHARTRRLTCMVDRSSQTPIFACQVGGAEPGPHASWQRLYIYIYISSSTWAAPHVLSRKLHLKHQTWTLVAIYSQATRSGKQFGLYMLVPVPCPGLAHPVRGDPPINHARFVIGQIVFQSGPCGSSPGSVFSRV